METKREVQLRFPPDHVIVQHHLLVAVALDGDAGGVASRGRQPGVHTHHLPVVPALEEQSQLRLHYSLQHTLSFGSEHNV